MKDRGSQSAIKGSRFSFFLFFFQPKKVLCFSSWDQAKKWKMKQCVKHTPLLSLFFFLIGFL